MSRRVLFRRASRGPLVLRTVLLAVAVWWCAGAWALAFVTADADAKDHDAAKPQVAEITEDELRQQLAGKTFYLRGGYLNNDLRFDEHGKLDGSSPQASHTLSLVEITRVRLEKHRVELEGVRYGLHFLGALPSEDQSSAVDRVRLTTKKKPLKIVLEREMVETPKKDKHAKDDDKKAKEGPGAPADQAKEAAPGSTAEGGPIEVGTDRHGVTVTTSRQHANQALRDAIDSIFSAGIDDRMIATFPDYWKSYYQAMAAKTDFKPSDAAVLRQSQVEKKARLLAAFDPPSNEYAQNNGVAGMAMYHVVVGQNGKPREIAVGRPIGFGLDENAVEAIRKASFEPAMKDGRAVPVLLDLTVQFRIYSKLTAETPGQPVKAEAETPKPKLPGPYSIGHP